MFPIDDIYDLMIYFYRKIAAPLSNINAEFRVAFMLLQRHMGNSSSLHSLDHNLVLCLILPVYIITPIINGLKLSVKPDVLSF